MTKIEIPRLSTKDAQLNYDLWSLMEAYQFSADGLSAIEECMRMVTGGELIQPPGNRPEDSEKLIIHKNPDGSDKVVSNGLINVASFELHYESFIIEPKRDFGQYAWLVNGNNIRRGYVVVKNHTLVLPGACWHGSIEDAKRSIDVWIQTQGNVDSFWKDAQKYSNL